MKKVLVVSDNPVLLACFKDIWLDKKAGGLATVEHRYSENNKSPSSMIRLGAHAIDFRDPASVSYAKQFDLIFSIHCKQIFPRELVDAVKCVNLHPGLNPYGRGWYPQVFSIIERKPAGATIHLMDAEVDHGGIIDRVEVPVFQSDTSLGVYERVIDAEKALLSRCLIPIIQDSHVVLAPEFEGRSKSLDDFRRLCQLDMSSVGTLADHIDLLRALSHGNYNNAYFLDAEGARVFVRVTLVKAAGDLA